MFKLISIVVDLVNCFGSCGERLVATENLQELSSPSYPNNYSEGLNCTWTIVSLNPANQVEVSILNLRTELCCDYMLVRNLRSRVSDNFKLKRSELKSGFNI